VIGGWIGLKIDPDLLAHLASGRQIALVSGTNGKTTTTRLTAAAMGVLGDVATNSLGANMPTGHTSALAKAGHTPYAVLEVDEHYLPQVLKATHPRVVALLNLSRDQLDRAKEVAMMAALWREALHDVDTHVVANADDPMVVWAASTASTVTWVASGQRWHDDSWVCPECGAHIERDGTTGGASAAGCAGPRRSGGSTTRRDRPGRRPAPGPAAPAGPGQPGQRRHGARRRRAVRRADRGCAARLGQVASIAGRYATVSGTDARSGCCWRRTRPAGWRPSTWPRTRRPCSRSTRGTPTGSTRRGSTTSTSRRCAAGTC
jgi:hypothetical protein